MRDTIVESSILKGINITNNPDSVIQYVWDENIEDWIKEQKYTYQYDTYGNKTKEVVSIWYLNEWELENKIDFFYSDSKLIEQMNYWWDWSYFEWIQNQQYNLSYDSNNNLIQNHYTKWSESTFDWINDSLYIYEYNVSNLLSTYYEIKWLILFNEWKDISKTVYTYDTSGNNTLKTKYLWELDLLIWESNQKNNYIYNANNEMIEQIQLLMNSTNTNWENDWKREYTYFDLDRIKDEIYFNWNSSLDTWDEDYKFISYYDENAKLINKTRYYYDWEQLLWDNQFQTLHDYYDNDFLSSTTYYYWNAWQWKELEKYNYYYPGYNSTKVKDKTTTLLIYPVPTNDKIFVSLNNELSGDAQIRIYDLSGRKVYTFEYFFYDYKMLIDLPELKNGIYMLNLMIEDKLFIKKIIISN